MPRVISDKLTILSSYLLNSELSPLPSSTTFFYDIEELGYIEEKKVFGINSGKSVLFNIARYGYEGVI